MGYSMDMRDESDAYTTNMNTLSEICTALSIRLVVHAYISDTGVKLTYTNFEKVDRLLIITLA
jgi:hypothetical protein